MTGHLYTFNTSPEQLRRQGARAVAERSAATGGPGAHFAPHGPKLSRYVFVWLATAADTSPSSTQAFHGCAERKSDCS